MFDVRSAFGFLVHTPFGPRKSGMPLSVEMPAPVSTTTRRAPATSVRASSTTSASLLIAGQRSHLAASSDQQEYRRPRRSTRGWVTAVVVVLFGGRDRADIDVDDYRQTSERMQEIVASIPGFISFNSYTDEGGEEMIVVRFDSLEALDLWRNDPEHLETQEKSRALWTEDYWVQVSTTVREYRWTRGVGYHADHREVFAAGSEIPASGPRDGP